MCSHCAELQWCVGVELMQWMVPEGGGGGGGRGGGGGGGGSMMSLKGSKDMN